MTSAGPSLAGAISTRIAEYLADDDPRLEWTKAKVREIGFLPLHLGWVSALGIRPDGSFLRWDYETTEEQVTPLLEPFLQRLAICQAAKKYPELRALFPERPPTAQTCPGVCRGTGEFPGRPELICECGGTGWVIPGESIGEATGEEHGTMRDGGL